MRVFSWNGPGACFWSAASTLTFDADLAVANGGVAPANRTIVTGMLRAPTGSALSCTRMTMDQALFEVILEVILRRNNPAIWSCSARRLARIGDDLAELLHGQDARPRNLPTMKEGVTLGS